MKQKHAEMEILRRTIVYLLIVCVVSTLIIALSYTLNSPYNWISQYVSCTLFTGTLMLCVLTSSLMTHFALIEAMQERPIKWIYWYIIFDITLLVGGLGGYIYLYSLIGNDIFACTAAGIALYILGGYKIPAYFILH